MSRSALWRQESNVKEREQKAQDTFLSAVEEGRNNRSRGIIPLHGPDDTFNLNPMLLQNIAKSPYFTKCCSITDWNALVDEIYYEVKHVEPWSPGAVKTPSTAFCLLLRLLTMRATDKQMKLMLDHKDSPYIRAVGFLYLRFACEPQQLWEYIEPYLYDEEPMLMESNPSKPEQTVGAFVRKLLSDMEYFGTRLPRLPVNIERDIKVKLLQAEQMEERAQRHLRDRGTLDYFKKLGSKVRALYGDDENPVTWYDAVVDRVVASDPDSHEPLSRPKFIVTFTEYGNTETVTLGEMEMPGGGRDEPIRGNDRGWDQGHAKASRGGNGRDDPGSSRGFNDQRGYNRGRDDAYRVDRSRSGDRNYDKRHHDRSRSRERDDDLMAEVIRREREQSFAKGRNYAARVPTTKDSLAQKSDGKRHNTYNDHQPPPASRQSPPSIPPPREKTADELATIADRKRKLMAKYG